MTLRDQAIEAMAPVLCRHRGYDPNQQADWLPDGVRWKGWRSDAEVAFDALLAFFAANGLRVVPVEPSNEMLRAACAADEKVEAGNLGRGADLETHWAVMLDAAPDVLGEKQNDGV